MRLLIIAPYPLLPTVGGGQIRIVHIARSLSALGREVSVLTPFLFSQRRALYAGEPFALHQFKYPFLGPFLFTNHPFPYGVLISYHPGLAVLLRRFLRVYDIYQFEHPHFADLTDWIPRDKVIIYDAHNVECDYTRSECRSRWVESLAVRRTLRLERKLVHRATHILACSASDRERLSELYGIPREKVSLAPNGITRVSSECGPSSRRGTFERYPQLRQCPRRVIYSGSDVPHNRAAVRFIVDELAPALTDQCVFVIHGTCGRRLGHVSRANVFFDPSPDNFEEYVAPGTVGLNPTLQGSGTNLKVLQYLSHGLPVVSTPFGMRGYEELKPFVTVAARGDFAEVLRRGEYRAPLHLPGLYERYEWRRIAQEIGRIHSELWAQNGTGSRGGEATGNRP